MTASEEHVLVIPRASIMADPGWHGITIEGLASFERLVERNATYLPRSHAEADRAWKQVIPYLVLRDGERYFLMRRTKAGGDARLHDRWSIGVGGHVDLGDEDLAGGLRREWHEELVAHFEPTFTPYALLNDDTTEGGAVHLGVVILADAEGRPVRGRETEKLSGAFATPAEV